MSTGRDRILGAVRRALRRGPEDAAARATVARRLEGRQRGPVPARSLLGPSEQVDLFESLAIEQAATVQRVATRDQVPDAVAEFLRASNLPPKLRLAPDPELAALPWDRQPLLELTSGPAAGDDKVSVTGAFAGIAETGTLMLISGPNSPSSLNFLPDVHIVVLEASQMVGPYEEAWDRLREVVGAGALPRTVNFITGPSRTADIEQTIQLGAHGPRRLHIVLVEDRELAKAETEGIGHGS